MFALIELSNTQTQTLASGQSLTFNATVLQTGCAESHRQGSGIVNLRAGNAIYDLHFSANVTSPVAGTVQLSVQLNGEPLPETAMQATVYTADEYMNVSTETLLSTGCGCCNSLTVANTGDQTVTVNVNPAFIVKRVA